LLETIDTKQPRFHGNVARSFIGIFRELEPLCGHLSENGARLLISRHLRQLKAMGGIANVLLSFVD
jgi:hypothetical protein